MNVNIFIGKAKNKTIKAFSKGTNYMRKYDKIKTIDLKENQRIEITFDNVIGDSEGWFLFTKTPGLKTRFVLYVKEFDDETIRHEVEMHTSMDGVNYYYNCFFDKVKSICIQDYGCEKKEVWRNE